MAGLDMQIRYRTKSNIYCCVPQCSSYYDGEVSFHTFPSYNKKLREEWKQILKIGKPVSVYMRICSKHFRNEDFFFKTHVNKKHRLKKNVVPSMNLPVGVHDKIINKEMVAKRIERSKKRSNLKAELLSLRNRIKVEAASTNDEVAVEDGSTTLTNETLEAADTLLTLAEVATASME